ncbi:MULTISPECIES: hypothetical protein [Vibrio]|uniref:hypothetical protein n=1 Tax=Vibrio TaxID=662 RepID=UPI00038145CC|nr:hypothetical protein [Vibrio breoganii]OED94289.1 hypothetical protein A1QG_05970 [Vibrio breoganii ZF-29]PMF95597.1 hypothetical protein BCV08_10715 [Vibrio breoganii]
MSFKTPSAWRSQYGIKRRYESLTFDRSIKDKNVDVLGVGHMIFNKAIAEAEEFEGSVAVAKGIEDPVLVYTVKDLITGDDGNQSFTAIAVTGTEDLRVLSDEALMLQLIGLYDYMPKTTREICWDTSYVFDADEEIPRYDSYLEQQLASMSLPYEKPTFTLTALLLPFVE